MRNGLNGTADLDAMLHTEPLGSLTSVERRLDLQDHRLAELRQGMVSLNSKMDTMLHQMGKLVETVKTQSPLPPPRGKSASGEWVDCPNKASCGNKRAPRFPTCAACKDGEK